MMEVAVAKLWLGVGVLMGTSVVIGADVAEGCGVGLGIIVGTATEESGAGVIAAASVGKALAGKPFDPPSNSHAKKLTSKQLAKTNKPRMSFCAAVIS